ncbi:MAG: hypothetical protein RLZZ385_1421 [Pseudomonadota bacterium]|jgi:hypothetical protein
MVRVELFTTVGCHLCEEAGQLLRVAGSQMPLQVLAVEISEDEVLVERYGIRIPVVRKIDDGSELGWPFDLQQLLVFLS